MIQLLDPSFSGLNIWCGFTGRSGGVSSAPFDALNLSFHRQDSAENVYENYNRLAKAIGVHSDRIIRANQVHGKACRHVTAADGGIRHPVASHLSGVDALVTNEPGIVLLTTHADCVPVYFYDPVHQAIGLAHAGWGGTLAGVVEETMETMHRDFSSDPAQLHIAFGPHIGACCFEVQADVAEKFRDKKHWNESFVTMSEVGRFHINLQAYIKAVLCAAGVIEQHILGTDICTKCNSELYFSHRGSGGNTGCGAAFIGLEGLH